MVEETAEKKAAPADSKKDAPAEGGEQQRAATAARDALAGEVTGGATTSDTRHEGEQHGDRTARPLGETLATATREDVQRASEVERTGVDPEKVVGGCKITGDVCQRDRGGDTLTPEQRKAEWDKLSPEKKAEHRDAVWAKGFDMSAGNGEKIHISRSGDTVTASQGDQKFELNREAGTQRYSDGKGNTFERGTDGQLHATIDGDQFTLDRRGIRQQARENGTGVAVFTHKEHHADGSGDLAPDERSRTIEARVRENGEHKIRVNGDGGEYVESKQNGERVIHLTDPSDPSKKTDTATITRKQSGDLIVSQRDASGADTQTTLTWKPEANDGKGGWATADGSATPLTIGGQPFDASSREVQVNANTRIAADGTIHTKMNGNDTVLAAGATTAEVTGPDGALTRVEAKGTSTTTTQCDAGPAGACTVTDTGANNTLSHALVAPQDAVRDADGKVQVARNADGTLANTDLTVRTNPDAPQQVIAHMGAPGDGSGIDLTYTQSAGTPSNPEGSYDFAGGNFAGTEMRSDYSFYGYNDDGTCWRTDPFSGNSYDYDQWGNTWDLANGYGVGDPYYQTAYNSYDNYDQYGSAAYINDSYRYTASSGDAGSAAVQEEVATAQNNASKSAGDFAAVSEIPTLSEIGKARSDAGNLASDASRLASLASCATSMEARCFLQGQADRLTEQSLRLYALAEQGRATIERQEKLESLMGSGQLTQGAVSEAKELPGWQSWMRTIADLQEKQRQSAQLAS